MLAPLLFSLQFVDWSQNFRAILAFFAFCFASSAIYILNDIADRKKDALHPIKKNRPIASGQTSITKALMILVLILALSGICLYQLHNPKVLFTILAYAIMNIAYSLKLKHIVLVDVFIIAFGFILRVYAGAYAIFVPVSSFIFMTTLFLSLFLAFTKRKGEMSKTGEQGREVLQFYNPTNINYYILMTATLTIMSYGLYTVEPITIERFGTNRLVYSLVFVIYGMFRYLYILDIKENSEDPTENLFRDPGLLAVCLIYVAYILSIFLEII